MILNRLSIRTRRRLNRKLANQNILFGSGKSCKLPMKIVAFLTLFLAVRMSGVTLAQEDLLSEARNERGLVIYGSPNLDDLNFLATAFTKKYSFAKPQVYRATSAAIYN